MHVLSYDDGGMTRIVQITFHQLLLNGNVTAITANLLLGSWNKGNLVCCVSFHRKQAK